MPYDRPHDDTTALIRRESRGSIQLDERLDSIDQKLDRLLIQSASVDKRVSLIEVKLELHDRILMGISGVVGLASSVPLPWFGKQSLDHVAVMRPWQTSSLRWLP